MDRKEKQKRLKTLLAKLAPEQDRIESIQARETALESFSALESIGGGVSGDADVAHIALERVAHDKPLSDEQIHALEAIIIPGERPVVDIEDDVYLSPEEPFEYFDHRSVRAKIEPAIPAIGRVELLNHPAPFGGTAFVVEDGIMMTNRHVAELFTTGLGREGLAFKTGIGAGIDFKHEIKSEDENLDPIIIDIEKILMIHPYWDMALLEVKGLGRIKPLTLATIDPRELDQRDVAVIGYPAFDPRNNGELQNKIFRNRFNVKRMQPGKIRERKEIASYGNSVNSVTHDSSTLGGNSGSAVIDASTGHVVALHFAGLYLDANYAVPAFELARDRRIVEFGIFDDSARPTTTTWDHLWDEADPRTEIQTLTKSSPAQQAAQAVNPQQLSVGTQATWSIPFEVTVRIGAESATLSTTASSDRPTAQVSFGSGDGQPVVERVVEPFHDKTYGDRPGYDQDFLGIRLPLPRIKQKKLVSKSDDNEYVLPYYHFSLVMHKKRRLAIYTASNIDGRPHKRKPQAGKKYTRKALARMGENDREKWFNDPRIPAEHQLHNVFYDEDRQSFDKGHLVRREDVTWGNSHNEIEKANGDTFHVTNCSPQVLHFNRSKEKGIWGQLENDILKQAKKDDDKYTVLSGPILADDDPVFKGEDDDFLVDIQIPVRFWKVIVVREDNELQSFAFMLEQDLGNVKFTEHTFTEFTELVFDDKWNEHRISLDELENTIGLISFPDVLHASDTHGVN